MLTAAKASDITGLRMRLPKLLILPKIKVTKAILHACNASATKIKQAKKAAKGGDFGLATSLTEEARVEMNKPDVKPNIRWND